jgi:hypothetical protein
MSGAHVWGITNEFKYSVLCGILRILWKYFSTAIAIMKHIITRMDPNYGEWVGSLRADRKVDP